MLRAAFSVRDGRRCAGDARHRWAVGLAPYDPTVGDWPKHPVKDIEIVLEEFASLGWTVERGRKYYSVKCPCGDHYRHVHVTPSDRRYVMNLRSWLMRQPCTTSGRSHRSV